MVGFWGFENGVGRFVSKSSCEGNILSQAHLPRSPDPEPDPAVHVILYLHRVAFTQQLRSPKSRPHIPAQRRKTRKPSPPLYGTNTQSQKPSRVATMSTSSASSLSASVQSLKSSLQLLDSSISILDQGISDFPRLSTVLSSTRVCSPPLSPAPRIHNKK